MPFNRGRHNVDEIRYDFFGDASVIFEAFKAGETSVFIEGSPTRWEDSYDFERAKAGAVVQDLIPHNRPSGITGFVMNTRRDLFADWRVRQAMIEAFNFEFINQTLNGGENPRITSYFSNSILGMREGAAQGAVQDLLSPFASDLLPGAIEGYALPVSDGSVNNRANLRNARALLEQAGWRVQDGVLRDESGTPFVFELILRNGANAVESTANIYRDALDRLGIQMNLKILDSAQYKERTNNYDFDMTYYNRPLSLSPGNEQRLYWGGDGVDTPGTRNWMGVDSPAVEAMIDAMLNANTQDGFVAAVRALDRVLTSGRYVVPIWHSPITRMARDARLQYPDQLPILWLLDWFHARCVLVSAARRLTLSGSTMPADIISLAASSTLISKIITSLCLKNNKKPEVGLGVVGTKMLYSASCPDFSSTSDPVDLDIKPTA